MKLKIFNGRTKFRQWDVNQKLVCEGVNLGTQIHFSSNGETALVVEPYELNGTTVVNVPNILLQEASLLYVYVYVHESDEKYTEHRAIFNIDARPKPDDYVYTQTEVLNYSTLDKRVSSLEDNLQSEQIKRVELHNGDTITLQDNTMYFAESSTPISNLIVYYPTTPFISSMYFTLPSSGEVSIYFPSSRYIGKAPDLNVASGETWELSIHNGIIASGKVVSE